MRGICFFFLVEVIFIFNVLVEERDLFATDCNGMFAGGGNNFQDQTNINYEQFQSSVVKITSYGSKRISRREIRDNSLSRNGRFVFLDRTSLSLWGPPLSTKHKISFEKALESFERTMESVGLGGPWIRCSGVVVSHNTLITTAHCIVSKPFIYYQSGGKTFYATTKYYYTSATKEAKMIYDVGVVVFPDHTFDNIRPLRIATKGADYESSALIGIKVKGEKRIQKDVRVKKQQDLFIIPEKEVSHLDEGSTWLYGPLVNRQGQLLGMSIGRATDDTGGHWLVCTDFTSMPIQALFKKLVEEKRAIISGIE